MASSKIAEVSEPGEWAKRTARRLRVAHGSFSDQAFDEKRGYLEDELDICLTEAGAESGELRERMLDALGQLFPVFGPVEVGSEAKEAKLETVAEELGGADVSPVDAALAAWRRAGAEERELILSELGVGEGGGEHIESAEKSGVLPTGGVSVPQTDLELADLNRTMGQLRELMGWSGDETLNYTRLFKILGMLADSYGKLHAFLWDFWDHMAPQEFRGRVESDIPGTLAEALSSYLSGSEEMKSGQISSEIEKTKLLAIAICSAVQRGGSEFGRQYSERFSPDQVESAVVIEDTGGDPRRVKNLEQKAWLKYRQLAKNLTPDGVDDDLKLLFGRVIGALINRSLK